MKHWRVAEIFGPTIQGEGRQAGLPCHFIRFGGCDLRCLWCDTPHAVLPVLISQLPKMNVDEICDAVDDLTPGPDWVVISGGNPATLRLEEVAHELHARGYKIMVETQATIWNDWLLLADEVCLSPKPPSSTNIVSSDQVHKFLARLDGDWGKVYLKVVVFDDDDYTYAKTIHAQFPEIPFYISVGNNDPWLPTVGNPNPNPDAATRIDTPPVRDVVCDSFTELAERVARDRSMRNVRVLPQLHVLAWGNARGH